MRRLVITLGILTLFATGCDQEGDTQNLRTKAGQMTGDKSSNSSFRDNNPGATRVQNASRYIGRFYPTIEEEFNENGIQGKIRYFFEEEDRKNSGKKPRVLVIDPEKIPLWVTPGKKIEVVGVDRQAGSEEQIEVLDMEPAESDGFQLFNPSATVVKKVVVILVDLQDAKAHLTADKAKDVVFNQNRQFYNSTTWNQIDFAPVVDPSGDVLGPFTVPYSTTSGSCADLYYQYAYAAETEAANAGYNLSGYTNRVFILPNMSSCSWAGVANLGSLTSGTYRAWVRVEGPGSRVISHELGHNIGLHHSGVTSTYDDYSCFMGLYRNNMNAAKVYELGTLNGLSGAVKQGGAGTYTMQPLFSDPNTVEGTRILRIAKPDTNQQYLISYRDESLLEAKYKTGISIHLHRGNRIESQLLKTLSDGVAWNDAANGITITQISKNADSTVSFDVKVTCAQQPISLSINPSVVAAKSGATASYSLIVKNNDAPLCGPSDLKLAASVPAGYSSSLGADTVNLSPGQQTTVNLSVTNIGSGGTINVSATDITAGSSQLHAPAGLSATVVIDDTAPSAPAGLTATVDRKGVYLSWTASIDNTGGSGIKNYDVLAGSSVIGSTSALNLKIAKPSTTTTYSVRAIDNAGNASVPSEGVTVTVTSGSGGGGGGPGKGGGKK